MDNHDQERSFVGQLYPGRSWKNKVKKMTDAQVLAISIREKQRAKKEKPKESKPDDVEPF